MKKFNRRQFVAATAALGAVAAFPAPALIARGANEDVRMAFLGIGMRAGELFPAITDPASRNMKVVGVCDPDATRLEQGKTRFGVEKAYADMRRVFDDPNIDAVLVTTCNHWHCLASIWAMQAGKDVYCEKPLCRSFWEGQQIVNAAKKYGRICQIGTQMRSDPVAHPEVKKFLHEEKSLGKILSVRVNRFAVRRPIGLRTTPLEIPKGVDYNLWLGPAQDLPLYRNGLHYDWHWMWNTGNGETGNWGAHLLDDCRNDVFQNEIKIPKRVFAGGARAGVPDAGDSPNTMFTYFDTGSIPVIFAISGVEDKDKRGSTCPYSGPNSGYVVYCEGGTYVKPWGPSVAYDNAGKRIRTFPMSVFFKGMQAHVQNFADAVRSGKESDLNAPIQVGYDSSFWYNAANTSYRLGAAYSREETLSRAADTGKLAEILDSFQTYFKGQEISMDSFKLGPMLELDATTRRFVGADADAANALMDVRPGRGEFVVPEVLC